MVQIRIVRAVLIEDFNATPLERAVLLARAGGRNLTAWCRREEQCNKRTDAALTTVLACASLLPGFIAGPPALKSILIPHYDRHRHPRAEQQYL